MSNKFSGILLVSDLDNTLLTTGDRQLSDENKKAIEYFMAEGGYFTFCTGRTHEGAEIVMKRIVPNAPIICYNGGTIYDFYAKKNIYGEYLDKGAVELLKFVDEYFPNVGIEVCTDNCVYFCRDSEVAKQHRIDENLKETFLSYYNIFSPWKKIVFPDTPALLDKLEAFLRKSEFNDKYNFVRSESTYFEALPKDVSKGSGLLKLAEILGISMKRTIAVGDNQNDVQMLKNAGIGVAVANAVSQAREAADYITVDNDSNALAAVIASLEFGRIKFD